MIKATFIGGPKNIFDPQCSRRGDDVFWASIFFTIKNYFNKPMSYRGQKLRSNSKTKPGFAAKRGLLPDGHTVEVCFFKV